MITKEKVIEIFCIIDEFDKNLSDELSKNLRLPSVSKRRVPGIGTVRAGCRKRNNDRPGMLSFRHVPYV